MHVVQKVVRNYLSKHLVGSESFSSTSRLLRKSSFENVLNKVNIKGRYFKVYFTSNNIENGRLGIIAGKRNLPRAVDRNRAKRIIREAFRHHSIKEKNLDIVVQITRPNVTENQHGFDELNMLFFRIEERCTKF